MASDNMATVKTAATLNLLAGIWLFISPWVYWVSSSPTAWNSWIVGAVIVLLAAIRISNPVGARNVSLGNLILGIWTFASPWIYGFTGETRRFVNSLCVGAIVFILAAIGSSMGRTTTLPPPVRP